MSGLTVVSSFKGSFKYTVDSKGRINIPAKMRKNLSPDANESFVITRGFENCIFVYPNDEWAKREAELSKLQQTNRDDRLFTRLLLQYATDVELDGQHRIVLTKELMEYAKISGDVLILGVFDRIEVWNPDEYAKYLEAQSKDYVTVAEAVFEKNE
ncbi:MAG: division/cell wall cluster transcriptional repressor MraZ [Bacteroidetes bacterium]|nr:division/cell wall cluster transcriptional repressor MraZ [Bacteroidota bacterium]